MSNRSMMVGMTSGSGKVFVRSQQLYRRCTVDYYKWSVRYSNQLYDKFRLMYPLTLSALFQNTEGNGLLTGISYC